MSTGGGTTPRRPSDPASVRPRKRSGSLSASLELAEMVSDITPRRPSDHKGGGGGYGEVGGGVGLSYGSDEESGSLLPEEAAGGDAPSALEPEPVTWVLKAVCMLALLFQNCTEAVILRYSRGIQSEDWSLSIMVMWTEAVKLVISVVMLIIAGEFDLKTLLSTSIPLGVPAFLYFVQNMLQIYAFKYVAVGTTSVLSQAKILSSALFAVALLGRRLSATQWRALGHLAIGCVLVVYQKGGSGKSAAAAHLRLVAIACLLFTYCLSGLNGVYVEKVLKKVTKSADGSTAKQPSIWFRNFQLAIYSIVFAALSSIFVQQEKWTVHSLSLQGSGWAWLATVIGAAGGILVALVLRYADVILKCFVSSISIIITTLVSVALFGRVVDIYFALGSGVVILSIFNYVGGQLPQ